MEKEKLTKVENKQPTNKVLQTTQYLNQPFRTNNTPFNQNVKPTTNDVHPNYIKNNFQNFPSGPYERNAVQNPPFQKTDMPSIGSDLNKIPQNINFTLPPSQHMFNAPPTVPNVNPPSTSFPSNLPPQRPQMNQQIPMPFQNMSQFSPAHDFNSWKQEDRSSSNWWSNSNQQSVGPNYQQRDYQLNFSYPNNMPYMPTNLDFNKQQPNQATNMLSPPWSSMQNNLPSNSLGAFEHANQGLSLRQAMLKETKSIPPIQSMSSANHVSIVVIVFTLQKDSSNMI